MGVIGAINMIIDKCIEVLDCEYQVVVNRPSQEKSPITVYINQISNALVNCYIYTILNPLTHQVYSTVLQNTDNHQLFDITKNLGHMLTKKYQCPSYVNINGELTLEYYTMLLKAVIDIIESD